MKYLDDYNNDNIDIDTNDLESSPSTTVDNTSSDDSLNLKIRGRGRTTSVPNRSAE